MGTAVIYGPRGKRAQEIIDSGAIPAGVTAVHCPSWRQATLDDDATPLTTLEEAAKFGEGK